MKDAIGQYVPIIEYIPDAAASAREATQAEMLEQAGLQLANILEIHPPSDTTPDAPIRGFGQGYEGMPEDIHTMIDVEKLVHDLKEMEVEVR